MLTATQADLQALTGRKQAAAQARVLTGLGIAFKVHPMDGRIITTPEAINAAILAAHKPKPAANGIQWSKQA